MTTYLVRKDTSEFMEDLCSGLSRGLKCKSVIDCSRKHSLFVTVKGEEFTVRIDCLDLTTLLKYLRKRYFIKTVSGKTVNSNPCFTISLEDDIDKTVSTLQEQGYLTDHCRYTNRQHVHISFNLEQLYCFFKKQYSSLMAIMNPIEYNRFRMVSPVGSACFVCICSEKEVGSLPTKKFTKLELGRLYEKMNLCRDVNSETSINSRELYEHLGLIEPSKNCSLFIDDVAYIPYVESDTAKRFTYQLDRQVETLPIGLVDGKEFCVFKETYSMGKKIIKTYQGVCELSLFEAENQIDFNNFLMDNSNPNLKIYKKEVEDVFGWVLIGTNEFEKRFKEVQIENAYDYVSKNSNYDLYRFDALENILYRREQPCSMALKVTEFPYRINNANYDLDKVIEHLLKNKNVKMSVSRNGEHAQHVPYFNYECYEEEDLNGVRIKDLRFIEFDWRVPAGVYREITVSNKYLAVPEELGIKQFSRK